MVHTGEPANSDQAMNLIDIGIILWRNKWVVIVTAALCMGLAIIYALKAHSWYRAEVLLKLTETRQGQGLLGQVGGGVGGLASLAGIDLSSNRSAEPIGVLKSRELAGAFIEDQNLLPVFFANKWDATAKHWKSPDIEKQPDIRDGVRYFQQTVLKIQEDRKTGLITVAVEWTDAKTAATWANLLVERVNDRMRQRALTEGESSMRYLKQQLADTNVVPLQQSIGRVIETELQQLILAKSSDQYAFRVIDHAEIPKWRDHPHRAVIVAVAFFAGGAVSSLFLISRHVFRRIRVSRRESQFSESTQS
jgi:uncharacterized protein involved in exopolysaccharide biosynthesis